MDILKYKDYEGTAELDMERFVCRGKILFIDDLVTYEAASPADLQKEFEAAVEDYLETCNSLGRPAKKPLKGQFNVRIPPESHKALALKAMCENSNINELMNKAVDLLLGGESKVTHDVRVTVAVPEKSIVTAAASSGSPTQTWGVADAASLH